MSEPNECPGHFKCHGPASWCDQCGDVDLICDDPKCEAHARGLERHAEVQRLRSEYAVLHAEAESKRKELEEAERSLDRWETGNPVMVSRPWKAKAVTA